MRLSSKLLIALIIAAPLPVRGQGRFSFEPISASATHTIVGPNEIRLAGGNQTVRVELRLSEWAPIALRGWQARVDSADYANGVGDPLAPAALACTTSQQCAAAYEFGSRCVSGVCTAGFLNYTRADWIHFNEETCTSVVKDVSLSSPNYLWFAATTTDCPSIDDGTDKYCGGLALFVPAGARGTYEIGFVEAESFFLDLTNSPIFPAYSPLRIVVLCGSPADCDDGRSCTIDECAQDGTCTHVPTLPLDSNEDCQIALDDLVVFPDCLAGPDLLAPVSSVCLEAFDVTGDALVDLADVAVLQNEYASGD